MLNAKKNPLKMISPLFITIISLGTAALANAGECVVNESSQLTATYQIEKTSNGSAKSGDSVRHSHTKLTIWRQKDRVAHQYPEREITEIWSLQKNQRIKLLRQFDTHQRGIEYTSAEIKSHRMNWSSKYQLIPGKFKNQLTKTHTEQKDCWTVEYYTNPPTSDENTKQQITLAWIPELQLMQKLALISDQGTKIWTLKKVQQNAATIQQAFNRWDNYYLTDYADIGDNESDPFLMKMINLGFIEHGASGFYNEKGEQLQGNHSSGGHGHDH